MQAESRQVNAWGDDALIVVRVDAHGVTLEVEGKLAVLDMLQLILVQVRPPPDSCVDHVREPLAPRHLQAAVQSALDGDALAGVGAVGGDGGDERVQFITFFLEFFDETFNGTLGKSLWFSSLAVTHEGVNYAQAGIRRRGGIRHLSSDLRLQGIIQGGLIVAEAGRAAGVCQC